MTYGSNAPKGFQPARSLGAHTNTGALNEYPITATNATPIFLGDLVSLSTLGTLQQCSVSTPAVGVFMGCKFLVGTSLNFGNVAFPFWPGNPGVVTGSQPVGLVSDDPNQIYTIQETSSSGASGTPLTQGAVGLNANIATTAAGGSTVTGLSIMSINNASTATTITNQNFQIVGLDPHVVLGVRAATPTLNGGQQTVGAFANWLVKLNTQFTANNVRPV